jgi:ligand-binding SRPBCC domain-containing protein
MRQHFATEQWLPFARPVVFAFFANPAHLPPLMPGWQQARIDEITLVPPPARPEGAPAYPGVAAGSGTRLLITARAAPGLPLRLPWLALIQDFVWNDHFCDLQVKGPFAYWRHCHSVRSETQRGAAGSVVRDEVTYELPLAPLSRIGASLGQAAMQAMFRYRQQQAEALVARYAEATASSQTRPPS